MTIFESYDIMFTKYCELCNILECKKNVNSGSVHSESEFCNDSDNSSMVKSFSINKQKCFNFLPHEIRIWHYVTQYLEYLFYGTHDIMLIFKSKESCE